MNPLMNLYHFLWAFFSTLLYRYPSKKIRIIGVTGTKGKSTVVDFIIKILEEKGMKIAALSSIKIKVGKEEQKNLFKMTMPGRGYLQSFLKKAVDAGCQYAVIEVTSEGILQYRHKFIDFETAVFTNLSPEHIERHGSFQNYKTAKGELFRATKKAHILNLDDENIKFYLQFPAKKKIGYTEVPLQEVVSHPKDLEIIRAKNCGEEDKGLNFQINDINFRLNLLGRFNVQNALAAICVGILEDVSLETCRKALENIQKIPGRMEVVVEKPFKVIVDYAHTPDALAKVYRTLKERKLICVLGSCGGGRDKWKRPLLGKIASNFCDEIILTNEDPYDEPPMEIIKQIFDGVTDQKRQVTRKVLDRRKAVKEALNLGRTGDTIVITGKGCEAWMCVQNGRKIPWDDREIVREEFKELKLS